MSTIAEVRAQYPQYNDMSDEALAGALHQKFYADMPADVFAEKIGLKAPDPVSINDIGRSLATGVPILGGLMNKANAATNAALAPVLNGFFDEKDQLPEATYSERYAHSLRDQEGMDAKFAAQHPIVNTAGNLVGGAAAMVPVVGAAPGLFGATGGLVSRMGMGAASNAALGGTDAAVRGHDPVTGAIVGGVLGAAVPVAETALSPIVSNITARVNPERYAQRQVARAVSESGQTPADLIDRLTQAAADGQSQFTLADALGNSGQSMLATATRGPGEGRTLATNFLENRQAGQGRRISNALAEGFNAPETAAATEARMTAARSADADAAYNAVRNDAKPVNLTAAINHIDSTISPGVHRIAGSSNIANDTVEQALQRARNLLTDENGSMLTDFAAVQRARGDIADWAQTARQGGQGNKARMLSGVVHQVDAAMENASAGHLAANRNFAQASRDIEAVQTGRNAFLRGRTEDTIPAFNALRPEAQAAFRSGYVDPAITQTQGAAFGVNKARPLLNDAFQAESQVMAPGADLMNRRIGREQTMFETRGRALGNSKTAENLADDAAMGLNPTTIMHVATNNWGAAIGSLVQAGTNAATGNTPAVRAAVARILLQNGATLSGPALNQLVSTTINRLQFLQQLARSGAGAAAVSTNQANRKPSIFKRQESK